MTNSEIIFRNSLQLMNDGILTGSGVFGTATVTDDDGNERTETIELPEVIHTFAGWKACGYIVRKGEKAKASFNIWKYKAHKHSDDEPDDMKDIETGDMFLTKAFFFTASQVEKIS